MLMNGVGCWISELDVEYHALYSEKTAMNWPLDKSIDWYSPGFENSKIHTKHFFLIEVFSKLWYADTIEEVLLGG